MTYFYVASEALEKSGSPLALHATLILILLVFTIRVSLEHYPRFWVIDQRVVLGEVIRYRSVVGRRHDEEDI